MKIKLATGADLMWIFTISFAIFLVIIYCVPLDAELQLKIFGKTFTNDSITIANGGQMSNESLKGFKFTLMMVGLMGACILIDKFVLIPFLNRYTKIGKIERRKIKEEGVKYKDGKKDVNKDN